MATLRMRAIDEGFDSRWCAMVAQGATPDQLAEMPDNGLTYERIAPVLAGSTRWGSGVSSMKSVMDLGVFTPIFMERIAIIDGAATRQTSIERGLAMPEVDFAADPQVMKEARERAAGIMRELNGRSEAVISLRRAQKAEIARLAAHQARADAELHRQLQMELANLEIGLDTVNVPVIDDGILELVRQAEIPAELAFALNAAGADHGEFDATPAPAGVPAGFVDFYRLAAWSAKEKGTIYLPPEFYVFYRALLPLLQPTRDVQIAAQNRWPMSVGHNYRFWLLVGEFIDALPESMRDLRAVMRTKNEEISAEHRLTFREYMIAGFLHPGGGLIMGTNLSLEQQER